MILKLGLRFRFKLRFGLRCKLQFMFRLRFRFGLGENFFLHFVCGNLGQRRNVRLFQRFPKLRRRFRERRVCMDRNNRRKRNLYGRRIRFCR
jgi:hypothetical protein